jgi:hypothetical protein
MFSQGSNGALPITARRAKRENGALGEDPPGSYDDLLTGRSDLDVPDLRHAPFYSLYLAS